MSRWLRIIVYLLGLAVLVGAAAWFFWARPIAVRVAVEETNVPVEVFGLGSVEARVLSRIGFEVAGIIGELHADNGERVSAGQVLARLQTREQEARVAQARANVAQADAAIHQANANLQKAQANLRQRQQINRRRQELLRRGTLAEEQAQEAQTALEVAAAELTVAASAIDVANANRQNAQAALALEAARLDKFTLRAPYDAIVVARQRELGAAANPGEPIFTLVDPRTIWALAHVDEASAGAIRLGQPAMVRLRSLPGSEFTGRVARIDIESDRVTEERRVYVSCEICPQVFFLGEQAEIVITVGRLERALLAPRAAFEVFRGDSARVWTVEEGRLALRDVRLGARTLDGRAQIVAGVPEGAAVVLDTTGTRRPGRAVARD
jgi:HlyD family secretion protein